MAKEACIAAKAEGNAAYTAGELERAIERYTAALEYWDEALELELKPKTFARGDCVVYNSKGFARVESAFTVMDEYFLKDLGTDKPIWVGDAGGDLKRFSRSDLQPVPQDLFDLRLACSQNLAAVKLKQEDFGLAIKWSEEALRMDGRAPKALMRKGAALLKSGQPGPASDVLLTAQEVSPKDVEVKKLLREAEKTRGAGWVCANGCCGPWGLQNHLLTPTTNLNTIGKGSTLGSTLGPMKFGPTTAGQKIVADDDSDSDCSTCPSDDNPDCSKKENLDTLEELGTAQAEPTVPATSAVPVASSSLDEAVVDKVAAKYPVASGLPAQLSQGQAVVSEQCATEEASTPKEDSRTAGANSPPLYPEESTELRRPAEPEVAIPSMNVPTGTNALSNRCSAVSAASFAALVALALAWQLGSIGVVATQTGMAP